MHTSIKKAKIMRTVVLIFIIGFVLFIAATVSRNRKNEEYIHTETTDDAEISNVENSNDETNSEINEETTEETTVEIKKEEQATKAKTQNTAKKTDDVVSTTTAELSNKTTKDNGSNKSNSGTFRITVYTPGSDGGKWGYQTATGATSKHLATCAVDPKVIPLGSTIKVGGLTLTAVDTGSAVKGKKIDIFYDGTRTEAVRWVEGFGEYHTIEIL